MLDTLMKFMNTMTILEVAGYSTNMAREEASLRILHDLKKQGYSHRESKKIIEEIIKSEGEGI